MFEMDLPHQRAIHVHSKDTIRTSTEINKLAGASAHQYKLSLALVRASLSILNSRERESHVSLFAPHK